MAISGKLSWPMRVHTNEDGDKTTGTLFFFLSVSMRARNKSELLFRRHAAKGKKIISHTISVLTTQKNTAVYKFE
jgi:hypothetical protein